MAAADLLRDLRTRLAGSAKADAVAGEFERRVQRYCGEHGIPQSVFLGRSLNERTTVTYRRDDDGNVVVTRLTERDPEWLVEDVESALLHQADEDAKCPGCGQPRRESFDGAGRYEVEAHTCAACAGMQERSWLAEKNRPKHGRPQFGRYFTVRKAQSKG